MVGVAEDGAALGEKCNVVIPKDGATFGERRRGRKKDYVMSGYKESYDCWGRRRN